jgi:hypothetical protein
LEVDRKRVKRAYADEDDEPAVIREPDDGSLRAPAEGHR